MIVYAEQVQYPVGHGGLHLTQLSTRDQEGELTEPFSVVFDCGGQGSPKAFDRHLLGLRRRLALNDTTRRLDILVLSHLHLDHINGFERLVGETPVAIERLVIPHYDDADRALLLAQSAATTGSVEAVERMDAVLANVGAWFQDRGVVQVIEVRASDGEGTEPPPVPPTGELPRDYRILEPPSRTAGEDPVVSTETIRVEADFQGKRTPSIGGQHVVENGSFAQVKVQRGRAGSHPLDWYLVPYCSRHIPGRSGHRSRNRLKQDVERILGSYRNAGHLLISRRSSRSVLDGLTAAYVDYTGSRANWNSLSLSLFNGLATSLEVWVCELLGSSFAYSRPNQCPFFLPLNHHRSAHAWLHTGDAELVRHKVGWSQFFANLLPKSTHFQLPHHGSRTNFDGSIGLPSRALAFVTCRPDDPKHPDPLVVNAVNQRGLELHRVDTDPHSALSTLVRFRV